MKKSIYSILLSLACFVLNAQTINFTVNTTSANQSITCTNTQVVVTASTNFSGGAVTYYWANNTTTLIGNSATLTAPGIYTVAAASLPNYGTQTISIPVNTTSPTNTITPLLQNITCSSTPANVTISIGSPTVNFISTIISPAGASITSNNQNTSYPPSGPGVYTTLVTDQTNGCSTVKSFTITSSNSFPIYTLASSSNFSLGCNTKSVTIVNFSNPQAGTPGAVLTYTIIGPGSSTVLPNGALSSTSFYSITVPGNYYAVIHETGSNCRVYTSFSILQNTTSPSLNALSVNGQIIDCNIPFATFFANSNTPNVSYYWANGSSTASINTFTVNSNQSAPSNTFVGNTSLTITDNNNLCTTQTIIPIYQNIFKPNASISALGSNTRACVNNSLVMFNISSTGIPTNSAFTNTLPIVGLLWSGPSPAPTLSLVSTYTTFVSGIFTLTAQDLNNGCVSTTTFMAEDCTNINENSKQALIQFYPNPCHNQLNIVIDSNSDYKIELIDLLGQKIIEFYLNKSEPIDVSSLPKGVYFISVSQNNKVIETSKFIKD